MHSERLHHVNYQEVFDKLCSFPGWKCEVQEHKSSLFQNSLRQEVTRDGIDNSHILL